MIDSLHQRPDLPFSDCEINPEFVGRFSIIRDYILVRAGRHLAMHSESALFDYPFPSSFVCLIRATAPKQLVSRLLSASASLPLAALSNSFWDTATCETDTSFAPHLELICRALDRGTNVLGKLISPIFALT
ncbi:hypothetical protein FBUS_08580 [Fasciolopsis buskii]|uniref:Uncharacterized protein n=1 Tax=Fasciolopsis buskii TaxID=27845 RepID=A0A8E0S2D4_9TREM|nr:hypothetical protein FBUS_08580 [Fasciolopsis buski]